jgi:2-dehydro-3-deoxygluconokinase
MSKVVTFGEILMRLSASNGGRFTQATTFDICFGGGEFNVATSLSNFGITTEFVSCLPKNDFGKRALMEIRKQHVIAENILFEGNKLGVYYLEEGASIRASQVIYDRAESSFSQIEIGKINWEHVFKDATNFHWSGITPAISEKAAAVCLEALKFAQQAGITISCDLNYRSKLWKYGKEPKEVMPQLLDYCHIILGDIDTALFMVGKETIQPDYQNSTRLAAQYDLFLNNFPNIQKIATTLRYSLSVNHQQIGGIIYDRENICSSKVRDIYPVIDRIGTGDAFMGGLLYGFLQPDFDSQKTLDFAVAACCLKHTIKGDVSQISLEEVEKLINGDASGNVSR